MIQIQIEQHVSIFKYNNINYFLDGCGRLLFKDGEIKWQVEQSQDQPRVRNGHIK